jgi:hypothetical protein
MDLYLTENRPDQCEALGLECGSCVRKAAGSVARICTGLETQGIHRLFFQLYPSAGCRPMGRAFEAAYREASATGIAAVSTFAAA